MSAEPKKEKASAAVEVDSTPAGATDTQADKSEAPAEENKSKEKPPAAAATSSAGSLLQELVKKGVEQGDLVLNLSTGKIQSRTQASGAAKGGHARSRSRRGKARNVDAVNPAYARQSRVRLLKVGSTCCEAVATYVSGTDKHAPLGGVWNIKERMTLERCNERLVLALQKMQTVWHLSPARAADKAAYDELVAYLRDKDRVGFVSAAAHCVYIIPPVQKFRRTLSLPSSSGIVGVQVSKAHPDE